MAFETVTTFSSLKRTGGFMAVTAGGVRLVLIELGGEVRAYLDECPHHGVPLSYGVLEGHVLTCRSHLWSFDARNGSGILPPFACLRAYPVQVEGGEVRVDVTRPSMARPKLRGPDDEDEPV